MQQHPRAIIVRQAENEIGQQVLAVRQARQLTDVETLQILSGLQASILKYMLRDERHPDDPDKSADVE